jgi:cell volume regulation protein A
MNVDDAIGTLALMLGAGLTARIVADVARVPAMLLLIAAGAIISPSIDVPLDGAGAQLLLTLGVSFILFHGGLALSARVLSRTALGLGLLVVPGVLVTAAVTGAVAAWAFDVPLLTGLMIGAALAPTDPAILIPLFDRLGLRRKLAETIVAESALNDPTGAVLALAFAAAVLAGGGSVGEPVAAFVTDVGISVGLGVVFGVVLALLISTRRAGVWRESAPLAVAVVVAASFVSIDFAGGSGYLGAFLAGLIVSNMDELGLGMHSRHEEDMRRLVASVSDVVVILVFVTLGANLPWDALWDELGPALLVVGALILVARPLVVALCLLPDRRGRWTRNELVFMAWTRETGVLPAAIAGILVGMGVPDADLVTVTVALALVVTVLLQTTTKPWLARRLRLLEPGGEP